MATPFCPHPTLREFLQVLSHQFAAADLMQMLSPLAGRKWGTSTLLGADVAFFGATHMPSRHIIAEWISAPMLARGLTRGKHHDATRYHLSCSHVT